MFVLVRFFAFNLLWSLPLPSRTRLANNNNHHLVFNHPLIAHVQSMSPNNCTCQAGFCKWKNGNLLIRGKFSARKWTKCFNIISYILNPEPTCIRPCTRRAGCSVRTTTRFWLLRGCWRTTHRIQFAEFFEACPTSTNLPWVPSKHTRLERPTCTTAPTSSGLTFCPPWIKLP